MLLNRNCLIIPRGSGTIHSGRHNGAGQWGERSLDSAPVMRLGINLELPKEDACGRERDGLRARGKLGS
jgi:hypothetical protein